MNPPLLSVRPPGRCGRNAQGFSLVEVMLTVLLGSFLVLAAVSVFLSSRSTMESSDALSSVQEASRAAFELMGRDIREAGGNPCSASLAYGNVLNTRASGWWAQVDDGIAGYGASQVSPGTAFGTAEGQRIAGTEAIDVHTALSGGSSEARVVVKMPQPSANIEVSGSGGFSANDIVLVCDPVAAYIFQITQVQGSGTKLQHNSGSGSPGNCTKDFTSEFAACNNSGVGYLFGPNATVAKITSARWYVGANARGGSSLFRAVMNNTGASTTPTDLVPTEIVENVENLSMAYLVTGSGSYVPASSVSNWSAVRAVRVHLELSAPTNQAASSDEVQRDSTQVIALRNRTL